MMTLPEYFLLMLIISFAAGFLGSLVGVGGGIIIVPALTLLFGVPVAVAAGASLIAVIATSSGAGYSAFGKSSPANYKVGMLLMTVLATGAVLGAITTVMVADSSLKWVVFFVFGVVMLICAGDIYINRKKDDHLEPVTDSVATYFELPASYYDQVKKRDIQYYPHRIPHGMSVMFTAGILSGMLGIGGGVFNNIAMNSIMKFPLKVSVATSNFMLGLTAAASVGIYLLSGDIYPLIAAPVAVGIMVGSINGRKMMNKVETSMIRLVFIFVIVAIGIEMILKGMPPI